MNAFGAAMKKSVLVFASFIVWIVGHAQETKNDTTAKEIAGVVVFSTPYEAQKTSCLSVYSEANC